ncbi:MAG: hypothetical protein ACRC8A_05740 [Microcoleaceae cyanobacterium]
MMITKQGISRMNSMQSQTTFKQFTQAASRTLMGLVVVVGSVSIQAAALNPTSLEADQTTSDTAKSMVEDSDTMANLCLLFPWMPGCSGGGPWRADS